MAKFITAKEAAQLIPDGASVGVAGMGLSGWAEEVGRAIRDEFKETGHPCNLNLKQGCAMGDWKYRGVTVLGEAGPGLVTQWSAAHIGSAFTLNGLVQEGKIKCHCLPQGVIINLWREIAAGRPGLITKIGLGTFVDPRVEGGRMSPETDTDACELIEFQGEEYLFYKSFPLDVALLRGTIADENGNISFAHESIINEGLRKFTYERTAGLVKAIELVKDFPHITVVGVYSYAFNDAGSTITQELAYGMNMGSEYLNLLQEAGVKVDEAAKRIKFTVSISGNYFMEIAKFRAARLLWANIVKAYGAKKEDSCKIKVHAVTSAWNQTVYDPYVNMLRDTTEAMSGAIGGVDSMEVLPFDHAYKKPGEFSNRIARNVQSLLLDESHFNKVVDPGAGSYYIEELTDAVAKTSWDLFNSIEKAGGYVEAFKAEKIQDSIKETSLKRDSNIATRRDTLLGTNQFPNFTEVVEKEVTKKVVTRKAAPKKKAGMVGRPLEVYRGAMAFEELRFKTDKAAKRPMAFMVTYGNLAMWEGAKAALKAKADIIVACSSDDEYANEVPAIAKIVGKKGIVVVAGDPECKNDLIAKGIENFISVRSNVLETLKGYQEKLIK